MQQYTHCRRSFVPEQLSIVKQRQIIFFIGTVFLAWFFACTVKPAYAGTDKRMNLSLAAAVKIAMRNNLGLRLDRLQAQSSEGTLEVERGAFDAALEAGLSNSEDRYESSTDLLGRGMIKEENLDWNASLAKTFQTGTNMSLTWQNRRYDTNTVFTTLNPSYTSSISLNLTQQLLKGRGKEQQTRGIRAAQKNLQAAFYLVDDKAAELAAQVKKAYWELVFALQDIEVKRLSLRLAKTLLEETRQKIEIGVLPSIEIYKPEAEVARREELLILSEKNIGNAEDALKLLMNLPDWSVSLVPIDIPSTALTSTVKEPVTDIILKTAMQNRRDIKAADLRAESAQLTRARAASDLLPSLALVAGGGINGLDDNYSGSLRDLSKESFYSWNIGLNFQVPFRNRIAKGSYISAGANAEKARIEAESLRQSVTRSVREAVRSVKLAIKSISATKKSSHASLKQLEAEQSKFATGLSTANYVLEAQEIYARTLAGQKRALIDYVEALADLDRVQGLIRSETVKSTMPEVQR